MSFKLLLTTAALIAASVVSSPVEETQLQGDAEYQGFGIDEKIPAVKTRSVTYGTYTITYGFEDGATIGFEDGDVTVTGSSTQRTAKIVFGGDNKINVPKFSVANLPSVSGLPPSITGKMSFSFKDPKVDLTYTAFNSSIDCPAKNNSLTVSSVDIGTVTAEIEIDGVSDISAAVTKILNEPGAKTSIDLEIQKALNSTYKDDVVKELEKVVCGGSSVVLNPMLFLLGAVLVLKW